MLGALRATQVQYTATGASQARIAYEIVRQSSKGPVALVSRGMTTLQPGDLVRAIAPNEAGRADSNVQAAPTAPASSAPGTQGLPGIAPVAASSSERLRGRQSLLRRILT